MKTAILHYSAPPVIGGVEAVIQAHAAQFAAADLPLTVIAGRGEPGVLPHGVDFIRIAEMDTLHPEIADATGMLNTGQVPGTFESLVERLVSELRPLLPVFDHVIIHNVLTKHFNLPLTAALFRLMDEGSLGHTVAWCHDLTWSSPNSRSKVFAGYPWELLKTLRKDVTYVAISKQRQQEVVDTFGCTSDKVHIIYNGVDPYTLLDLSEEGAALMERMDLWDADLILLMPVRVTTAKNIEYAMHVVAALKSLDCHPKLILTGPPDPHDSASMTYYETLLELRQRLGVEQEMRFVFESGVRPGDGYTIDQSIVAELYRTADVMFMPSHREGFGMPVLEAGLIGLPILSTAVPAVRDLAQDEVLLFSPDEAPLRLAERILDWLKARPEHQLRVKVRQQYTWRAIFKRDLLPLLEQGRTG